MSKIAPGNHGEVARNLIAPYDEPELTFAADADDADVLALAQVHATLAQVDALREIAETLKGIPALLTRTARGTGTAR